MVRTLFALIALLLSLHAFAREARPLYRDATQPVEARVDDLLDRMTLQEKVGQMTQINLGRLMGVMEWDVGPLNEDLLQQFLVEIGVGSVLSGGGFAPVPNTPSSWAQTTNALQRTAVENTRLGIPLLYGIDAVHGHNNVLGATLFPHNLGLAASWDPTLARRIARSTARAMRATGVHWNFAPVADAGVDPRWGRFYETFGEDPHLASQFVRAAVDGYQQGNLSGEASVAATIKHFVGYGAGAGGQDRAPAVLSSRTLREVHLPPARAGLEAGAATVMANSGAVNGVPVHASNDLLTDLLRSELGFGGVVVSDWEDILKLQTVHKVAKDFKEAVAMSINAGVDMYMVPNDAETFTAILLELVGEGTVPKARIDEAVRRILTLKFKLGLFEDSYVDPEEAERLVAGVDTDLAREAAVATMTLLENDGVLPLTQEGLSLLVTGPNADNLANQMGGWTVGWQGVPEGSPPPPGVTFLEGLREALREEGTVTHFPGIGEEVAEAALCADIAVVIVGETPYAEGEGDRDDLELPQDQIELIRQVAATETPTVVVMVAGRPLTMPKDLMDAVDALVMAYLPGSQGGPALADVLFGEVNLSGGLPFSWPRRVGQLPSTYSHLPGRTYDPLFPFGHGLSYTTFSYGNVEVRSSLEGGEAITGALTLSAEVANEGDVAGTEVVQVYLTRPPSGVLTPERELIAFRRVRLEPGELKKVTLEIPASRLSVLSGDVNEVGNRGITTGTYQLSVGDHQITFDVD